MSACVCRVSALRLRRRGLLRLVRNVRLEGGPGRRARCPDRHLRLAALGIVERASAHADIVTPHLGLREYWCAARRTESPVHEVAAVGSARIVGERAFDRNCLARKERVHRAGARAEILAIAAPAMPREQRLGLDGVAHRAAAASARDGHSFLLCCAKSTEIIALSYWANAIAAPT